MSARASFSHDSKIVNMPLPNSVLLKDYLLDDLSSCSSNGFRSYPRRQCCTKVRYLIEIDLHKHIKLPPSRKQLLKSKSKPKPKPKQKPKLKLKLKSALVLHKASAAVVNVFKKLHFSGGSGSGSVNHTKVNFLSKHGFWKRTTRSIGSFERFKSFDESIKRSENMNMNMNMNMNINTGTNKNVSAVVTTITTAKMKTSGDNSNSNSNSNSSASLGSYFTATSNSSTTGGSSKIIVVENDVIEREELANEKMNTVAVTMVTATTTTSNTKKKLQSEEKDIFSPISVIDFPCDRDNDEEDEVTSPFQHSPLYAKGCKQKLMSKCKRTKSLARLNPIRLEDRITLSESRTHGWILKSSLQFQRELAAEKKAIALLQLLKATMSSHDLSESPMTERVLLEFFTEKFIEGTVSNYIILQEAKDWINGETKDMFESQDNKLTCIKKMEKGVNWLKYDDELETREVVSELEYQVFATLVEETLLDFYL